MADSNKCKWPKTVTEPKNEAVNSFLYRRFWEDLLIVFWFGDCVHVCPSFFDSCALISPGLNRNIDVYRRKTVITRDDVPVSRSRIHEFHSCRGRKSGLLFFFFNKGRELHPSRQIFDFERCCLTSYPSNFQLNVWTSILNHYRYLDKQLYDIELLNEGVINVSRFKEKSNVYNFLFKWISHCKDNQRSENALNMVCLI